MRTIHYLPCFLLAILAGCTTQPDLSEQIKGDIAARAAYAAVAPSDAAPPVLQPPPAKPAAELPPPPAPKPEIRPQPLPAPKPIYIPYAPPRRRGLFR